MAQEYLYSVSFEHDTAPVRTFSGKVRGTVGAAARRAIEAAKKQSEIAVHFRSVVVVLEKLDSSQK